jgi:hypothetical protein
VSWRSTPRAVNITVEGGIQWPEIIDYLNREQEGCDRQWWIYQKQTYHRWARKDQVERCYPQMREFLALKRLYDPGEVFQSNWYRHYRDMFRSTEIRT